MGHVYGWEAGGRRSVVRRTTQGINAVIVQLRSAGVTTIGKALLWLTLWTLVAACARPAPKTLAPAPPQPSTRDAGNEAAPVSEPGPPQVVSASPKGEATAMERIRIAFNKPIRQPGLPTVDPNPPVSFTPPVEGRWEWTEPSVLQFTPEQPLPAATEFRVTVADDLRAVDGTVSTEAYQFKFNTTRPALTEISPDHGEQEVSPKDLTLRLTFNQRIDPLELIRKIKLSVDGEQRPLSVSIVLATDLQGNPVPLPAAIKGVPGATHSMAAKTVGPASVPITYHLKPKRAFAASRKYRLTVDGTLKSLAGPLPLGETVKSVFTTAGPPRVLGFRCTADEANKQLCSVNDYLDLRLTQCGGIGPELIKRAISVTPPVSFYVHYPTTSNDGAYSCVYGIHGNFQGGRRYQFRLRSFVARYFGTDGFKRHFIRGHVSTFQFGDRAPNVRVSGTGEYWPTKKKLPLPLEMVNVTAVKVDATVLTPEQLIERFAKAGPQVSPDVSFQQAKELTAPRRNRTRRTTIDVQSLLSGTKNRGPTLIRVRYQPVTGDPETTQTWEEIKEIQLTDLGMLATASPRQVQLWITELSSGNPVKGAQVELRSRRNVRQVITTVQTDDQGRALAVLPEGFAKPRANFRFRRTDPSSLKPAGELLAIVRQADDWAYQTIEVPYLPKSVGMLFTERGLYRPGETVHLKGIFRLPDDKGLKTPAKRTVQVAVHGFSSGKVRRFDATLSEFGTFAHSVMIPQSAPLGGYGVRAQLAGGTAHTGFEVLHYEPVEAVIEASFPRPEYVRGDKAPCQLRGRYLSGGPLLFERVDVDIYRQLARHRPAGLGGGPWVYDDSAVLPSKALQLVSTAATLDQHGRYHHLVPLQLPGMNSPERVYCSGRARVFERSGSNQAAALVHPGQFYLGLKKATGVAEGAAFTVDVLAVGIDGKRKSVTTEVELVERTYRDNRIQRSNRVLKKYRVRTSTKPVRCAFVAPRGEYAPGRRVLVVRARAKDERRNPISASYSFIPIDGPNQTGSVRSASYPHTTPSRLSKELVLVPKRAAYQVGQNAQLRLTSPFRRRAHALVSVVRETVLWQRYVELPPRGAAVDIPITKAMVPNAEIWAVAVLGDRTEMAVGQLDVAPQDKRLEVEVLTPGHLARPGQEIALEVRVRDAQGQPARAEVTLYGADVATLWLAEYETPLPIDRLFEPRASNVTHVDNRNALFEPNGIRTRRSWPPRVRMGATSTDSPRGDFRQTVLFEPELHTDPQGRVRHLVKLPEGLTSYRFMAVAVAADDRFGSGEAEIRTSKPFMVRSALPRVIRKGDRFKVPAILSTTATEPLPVKTTILPYGLVSKGAQSKQLLLRPEQPRRLWFELAAPKPGRYKLVVRGAASSGGVQDAMVLKGDVKAPLFQHTAVRFGSTRTKQAESFGDLSAMGEDGGELEITLSKTPLAGLADGIEPLLEYPYGCTEQTSSRLLPLVSLRGLAEEVGVSLPARITPEVAKAVRRLEAYQQPDGGFGFWSESRGSEPWLSAYVLWVLVETKRAGYDVPQTVIARALKFVRGKLEKVIQNKAGAANDEQLATAAFIADVLATAGYPAPAAVKALYQVRRGLPLFAQAMLLHAMALQKSRDGQAITTLRQEIEKSLRYDRGAAYVAPFGSVAQWRQSLLDSEVRTSALVLRALLAVSPNHRAAPKLVEGLLRRRDKGRWATTQQAAWVLVALDEFRRSHPTANSSFGARVMAGEQRLASFRFAPGGPLAKSFVVPVPRARKKELTQLVFEVLGDGQLHYYAKLRYGSAQPATKAVQAGFAITKTMGVAAGYQRTVKPSSVKNPVFGVGDLIRVDIKVHTKAARRHVALDDPVPGGLVAVDLRRRRGSYGASGKSWTRRELRDDRVVFFVDRLPAGVHHFSYWARARTPGSFSMPPTGVFEMYAPEIQGATPGSKVTVNEPQPPASKP